jgi:transcriptional regulator GlxA family with amidase domain
MKAAFVLFDHLTALDFIGVYDPVTRLRSMNLLPDFEWKLCACTGVVTDDRGLRLLPDNVGQPLADFDLVIVPGGIGTRALMGDTTFLDWLRTGAPVPLKASVCTGSLLLGAAGFLSDKRATTHPSAMAELTPHCAATTHERVVDTGDIITAGGVTAAIDCILWNGWRVQQLETLWLSRWIIRTTAVWTIWSERSVGHIDRCNSLAA